MSGWGHVTPGGPPLVRRLSSEVTMVKLSVGPMDNNAYLLTTLHEAVLIDAANDAERLLALLDGVVLRTIITTHRHRDHLQALAEVAQTTGARVIAGEPDASAVAVAAGIADVRGVWDGERIAVGAEHLEVIGLVGHTPGSIALAYQGPTGPAHLFTGDSLFPGGPGRTTTPQAFDSLMADLQSKVFDRLPNETWFYPGHGDDSTLGAEREAIPEWLARRW